MRYHAVMIGEDGMEFGADVTASSKSEAREELHELYPEARIDQIESPDDTREREAAMYDHIQRGGDWDDEGRPIHHYDYDEDDDEDD